MQISENPEISDSQRDKTLASLSSKVCESNVPDDHSDVCGICRATVAQMESDIAAAEALKTQTILSLQELAAPEKKVVRVRVSAVLGNVVDNPEDLNQAIERLKEHLLKLLAKGVRIVLE